MAAAKSIGAWNSRLRAMYSFIFAHDHRRQFEVYFWFVNQHALANDRHVQRAGRHSARDVISSIVSFSEDGLSHAYRSTRAS